MSNIAELIALADQHFLADRRQEAEFVCREILKVSPENLEALHMLGLSAVRTGRNEVALQYLTEAVKVGPLVGIAHNTLGEAYRMLGRLKEAFACYTRALELDPSLAEANLNCAIVLRSRGEFAQSILHCQQAIRLKPALAQAHLILGELLAEQRQTEGAIASFRTALHHQPGLVEARARLASTLRWNGRISEAIQSLFDGLVRQPSNVPLRSALALNLQNVILNEVGAVERDVLVALCMDDSISMMDLTFAILGLIKASPAFPVLLGLARSGTDPFNAATGEVSALTNDRLIIASLPRMAMMDTDLELVLTSLRRSVLTWIDFNSPRSRDSQPISKLFSCALARHCFFTEYSFLVEADETQKLEIVRAEISSLLLQATVAPQNIEDLLICSALYGPLSTLPNSERLYGPLMTEWSESFRPLLQEQLLNLRREREIVANISALTPIRDEVSIAVREQYEENPYPRWASIRRLTPENVEDFARALRPTGKPVAFPRPIPVLIAGCGTGHHPIQRANAFRDCDVLAVDLSRTSLAYAARMAEHLGVKNVHFAQADILELGGFGSRFAIIECGGVLHHLRDPLAGWRVLLDLLLPGGLMKIALYSARGRQSIPAARDFVQAHSFKQDAEGIRECRRAIIDLPAGDPVREAASCGDFYSLTGCRDLIMHAQEHVFTLAEISELLDQLNLQFLAFECSVDVLAAFDKVFPDSHARIDLGLWGRFEEANPSTFANMYQFWCCRKSDA